MGGRGAGYIGGGPIGIGAPSDRGIVAKVNRLYGGNRQNEGHMLDTFRNEFVNDTNEHLISIDQDGFAHVLMNGEKGSVGFLDKDVNGRLVIHNHPYDANREGGTFSYQDLMIMAKNGSTGIVASERSGDWIVKKGKNFNSTEFLKGLNKSGISNYIRPKSLPGGRTETANEALTRQGKEASKWLTANASKYGYTFRFRTDSRNGSGAKSRDSIIASSKKKKSSK